MKQMTIDPQAVIDPDFNQSAAYKLLNPTLFKEGDSVCCLYGPDPQVGIFGCGDTAEGAAEDWENNLKQRINAKKPDDDVIQEAVQEMEEKVAESKRKTLELWEHQFRSVRRKG